MRKEFIMKFECVSFDIYDTLIGRLYPTEILYKMISEKLKSDAKFQIVDFPIKRVEAEHMLIAQGKRYYSLFDIYSSGAFSNIKDENRHYLIQLEEEFETQNAYPLEEGKRLFKQYKEQGKRIICISDMYLDSRTLKNILNKNGYEPEKIYVSCECNASKRDSTLFKQVLRELGVPARRILHIGDAIRSDIVNARKSGLHIHKVSKNGIISSDEYFQLGFQRFGRLMFEFIKWIHRQSNGRKLIFLTREGVFFQQCFQMIYDDKSYLMAVSRKGIIKGALPVLLNKKRFSEIVSDMSLQLTDTVSDLFRRVGLSIDNYRSELQEVEVSDQDSISKLTLSKLDKLFENNKKKIICELRSDQDMLDKYLKQFVDKSDSVAIVDIGWKGSMQNTLQAFWQTTDGPQDVIGLYFGTTQKENKRGFLFEDEESRAQDTLCFSGLIEILTTPCMGSVTGYRSDGDMAIPVFAEPEFSKESSLHINAVQQGIFEYIRRASYFKDHIDDGLEQEKNRFVRWGCFPTAKDINLLGSLDIYDNDVYLKLIEPITLKDLIQPKEIKRKLLQSKWKTGALKKIFIINLPYNRFINYLRKKRKEIGK